MITPEKLAILFHDTYEEVTAEYYKASHQWLPSGSKAWDEIPVMPRRIFIEVCRRILASIDEEEEPIKPNRHKWK